MSSNWLTDFDLFLHTKGSDDVQLWRLKKTESLSSSASLPIMRLTSDDFEYVSEVKDHQKLIENKFQWNITDYNNLINYISTRRLLVNGEGMVIAELLQYDEDENELLIYFRSPDVLSLKTYIPSVQNRKKVKDVVVPPPPVVDSNNSTLQEKLDKEERSDKQILAKRAADLEAENKTLETNMTKLKANLATKTKEITAIEIENRTLETDVTKLKTDLATRTKEVADLHAENKTSDATTKLEADLATKTKEIAELEVENKTLETDVTKLKANLATKTNEIADLEAENKTLETDVTKLKADLATRTNEIADLETKKKTMETDMAKLTASLAARTNENADIESKHKILTARTNEVWMNDFTTARNWVGIESLSMVPSEVSFTVIQNKGCFTKEDNSQTAATLTNVSARYWFQALIGTATYKVIELDELLPNKEKARFWNWSRFQSKGKTYAYRS